MAYLYRHIRLDKNEPFYIGIGNSEFNYYRAGHKSNRNKIWRGIVEKSDYKTEILFDNIDWSEACEKEKEFISIYGKIIDKSGTLANITDGGDGSLGCTPWNKGIKGVIKFNQSTKDKMSLTRKGRTLSDEHKRKIGQSNKMMSDETKKKLSDINKGNKNFHGKKHKESSKILISLAQGKKILDIDNSVCHYGATAAAIFLNVSSSHIRNVMSGLRKNKLNLHYI